MLAKINRFHRRNHVQYVHRKGISVRGNLMSLRYVRDQDHDDYRVAVVVSKKVDKRAVVRNRIRRRVYSRIRTLSPPLVGDVDVVISVFDAKAADMSSKELDLHLTDIINRAKIRKKSE